MTKQDAAIAANAFNRSQRVGGITLSTSTMAFPMWSAQEGWHVVLPKREG